jgi:hypothetical protein
MKDIIVKDVNTRIGRVIEGMGQLMLGEWVDLSAEAMF